MFCIFLRKENTESWGEIFVLFYTNLVRIKPHSRLQSDPGVDTSSLPCNLLQWFGMENLADISEPQIRLFETKRSLYISTNTDGQ